MGTTAKHQQEEKYKGGKSCDVGVKRPSFALDPFFYLCHIPHSPKKTAPEGSMYMHSELRRSLREFISLGLEALLWCVVMVWLFYLAYDIRHTGSWRSAFEFVLLGLLVWWPMIRVRLKEGYWP
jgi:cytochrome c oxidase assembly factor CtaG